MDLFSTAVLNRVVPNLLQPYNFLLDMFFPNVQTSPDSQEIYFDIDNSKPRIAPFVSPLVAGKVMTNDGYSTRSFRPAYVKDKRRFDAQAPLRRRIGEQIGGALTPAERQAALIAAALESQLDALTRREVLMAAEILITGKVTIAGEKYPTVVVDFLRDAGLTVTLGSGSKWTDSGVSPIDNVETWVGLVQDTSGAMATTCVMDPKAWGLYKADPKFLSLLDNRNVQMTAQQGQPVFMGSIANRKQGRNVGTNGDIDLWVYQDVYTDENGATQKMVPDYSVILGDTANVEGTRCYGVIQDEEANWTAERYFSKSWLEKDPAIRYLLLQSAPLVVPYRPNATFYAKVG